MSNHHTSPRIGDIFRLPSARRVRVDDVLTGGRLSCRYLHPVGPRIDADRGEVGLTFEFLANWCRKEPR